MRDDARCFGRVTIAGDARHGQSQLSLSGCPIKPPKNVWHASRNLRIHDALQFSAMTGTLSALADMCQSREGLASMALGLWREISDLLLRRTANSKLTVKADSPTIRPVPSADRCVAGKKRFAL